MALARTRPVLWARRKLSRLPRAIRIAVAIAVLLPLLALTNLVYHVIRKPTELFFFVGHRLDKEPAETWRQYGRCSAPIPPARSRPNIGRAGAGREFRQPGGSHLLALAMELQSVRDTSPPPRPSACSRCWMRPPPRPRGSVSGATRSPIPVAASPVFMSARSLAMPPNWRPCIWIATWHGFWPARATSRPARSERQDLAAFIHLCGAGPATAFARRNFRMIAGERCGDHLVAAYVLRVNAMKREFVRLAAMKGISSHSGRRNTLTIAPPPTLRHRSGGP